LREHRIVIFVDGAFWHGWRLPAWRHKLSEHWEQKIESNRRRDRRNHMALRRSGWKVIRLWDFRVKRCPEVCLRRILSNIDLGKRS
jgi:DNA mismatch endonuclease (patch repair protein)